MFHYDFMVTSLTAVAYAISKDQKVVTPANYFNTSGLLILH